MKEEVMGKLFLVSIGPGDLDLIPPRAVSALQASEIIVGYQLYLDLILPLIEGKTFSRNNWDQSLAPNYSSQNS